MKTIIRLPSGPWRSAVLLLLVALVPQPDIIAPVLGQRQGPRSDFIRPRRPAVPGRIGEFTFARLKYGSNGWGYGYQSWTTDYPKADYQFIFGLRGWVRSTLDLSDDPVAVAPDEPGLFRYPFIYIVEPGQMELTNEDAVGLREYLLRGGFLILDDFWGTYEWDNVRYQLQKVFPEYQFRQLQLDHPIFHSTSISRRFFRRPIFRTMFFVAGRRKRVEPFHPTGDFLTRQTVSWSLSDEMSIMETPGNGSMIRATPSGMALGPTSLAQT
jgi:hypothetical protein